jgi:hypothetical protein
MRFYGGNCAWKETCAGSVMLPARNWRHLPSVHEGFGVAFLDWQADYRGARATAVPEPVPHGLLVDSENADALANAIEKPCGDSQFCAAEHGRREVDTSPCGLSRNASWK